MDKSEKFKTKRSGGYSQRQLRRIVKKLTEEDCENVLGKLKSDGKNKNKFDDETLESDISDCSSSTETSSNDETESSSLHQESLIVDTVSYLPMDCEGTFTSNKAQFSSTEVGDGGVYEDVNEQFLFSDDSSDLSSEETSYGIFNSSSECSTDDCEGLSEEFTDNTSTLGEIFKNKIRQWALKFHITLIALSALLFILQPIVNFPLPLDARTLLGTLRHVNISHISDGNYYHFGLKRAVKNILKRNKKMGKTKDEVKLCFNIDGLPIFKSAKEGFWLILCSEINAHEVYPVGAYFGKKNLPTPTSF